MSICHYEADRRYCVTEWCDQFWDGPGLLPVCVLRRLAYLCRPAGVEDVGLLVIWWKGRCVAIWCYWKACRLSAGVFHCSDNCMRACVCVCVCVCNTCLCVVCCHVFIANKSFVLLAGWFLLTTQMKRQARQSEANCVYKTWHLMTTPIISVLPPTASAARITPY